MKRFLSISILLAFFILCGCGRSVRTVIYQNEKYRFRIEFPQYTSEIERQTKKIHSDAGPLDMTFFMAYSEHAVFAVGVLPHGFPSISKTLTMESLRYARRQMSENTDILEENDFTLNGYPAVSTRFRREQQGKKLYTHLFITDIGGIQYQVQMTADSPALLDSPEAVRYFLSFLRF